MTTIDPVSPAARELDAIDTHIHELEGDLARLRRRRQRLLERRFDEATEPTPSLSTGIWVEDVLANAPGSDDLTRTEREALEAAKEKVVQELGGRDDANA